MCPPAAGEHGRIDGFPFWCEVDFGCAIPVVSHVQGRFSKQQAETEEPSDHQQSDLRAAGDFRKTGMKQQAGYPRLRPWDPDARPTTFFSMAAAIDFGGSCEDISH